MPKVLAIHLCRKKMGKWIIFSDKVNRLPGNDIYTTENGMLHEYNH